MYNQIHMNMCTLPILKNISFIFERERERESVHKQGQRIQSGLCADSSERDAGLELMNRGIMTRAKVGHSTN